MFGVPVTKKYFGEIESLYGTLIWSGPPNTHNKAKVACDEVCMLKNKR